ncbi:hypothetical protein M405DRAFT_885703 [Rhizopogon salebrosus TDB-379]|nr:hypothetical protein M405DRAFT_885703 [Rhizopogon salebrosus TDB-379]
MATARYSSWKQSCLTDTQAPSQAHPTHVFTNTSTNSAPTADIPDDTSAIMNSAGAFESTEPDTIPDVTAEFLRSDNRDCDPESSEATPTMIQTIPSTGATTTASLDLSLPGNPWQCIYAEAHSTIGVQCEEIR